MGNGRTGKENISPEIRAAIMSDLNKKQSLQAMRQSYLEQAAELQRRISREFANKVLAEKHGVTAQTISTYAYRARLQNKGESDGTGRED